MSNKNDTNELVIERIYDAPRELVWKAWTDPEMFRKWWGPKDFTCPFSKIDLRVGGKYLNCMRGPDGKDYWSTGTYKQIVPMQKIVATDSFADESGKVVPSTHYGMQGFPLELEVTVIFEDLGGKTKMTLRHRGLPKGDIKNQARAGWNESFDKLMEVLSQLKEER
jgi:uncharacterized protein YndB with AHSA1/START domain